MLSVSHQAEPGGSHFSHIVTGFEFYLPLGTAGRNRLISLLCGLYSRSFCLLMNSLLLKCSFLKKNLFQSR